MEGPQERMEKTKQTLSIAYTRTQCRSFKIDLLVVVRELGNNSYLCSIVLCVAVDVWKLNSCELGLVPVVLSRLYVRVSLKLGIKLTNGEDISDRHLLKDRTNLRCV